MADFGTSIEYHPEPLWRRGSLTHSWATAISTVALTSSLVVTAYIDADGLVSGRVFASTISGAEITEGTHVDFFPNPGNNPLICDFAIERVTDSTFIIVYKVDATGPTGIDWDGIAIMGSVSGTTITLGSAFTWLDYSALSIDYRWNGLQITRLSSTKALVGFARQRATGISSVPDGYYLCVIEMSGTTVTGAGTVTLVGSGVQYHHISMDALDSTSAVILEGRRDGTDIYASEFYAVIASISGTSVSLNTAVQVSTADPLSGSEAYNGNVVAISATTFVTVHTANEYPAPSYSTWTQFMRTRHGTVSGTTISMGSQEDQLEIDANAGREAFNLNTCYISAGLIATGYVYDIDDSVGEARVTTFNISGTTVSLGDTIAYTGEYTILSGGDDGQVVLAAMGANSFFLQFNSDPTFPPPGIIVAYGGGAYGFKVLGESIGKGAGDLLYVTAWSDAGEIVLKVYDLPAMTLNSEYSLGLATEAQINSREFWAVPFTLIGNDNALVLYGRMNNPGGLGTVHMLYSADAGASVIPMEDGFDDDHIGSVCVDYFGRLFAARNISGASPKLYQCFPGGTLSLLSTIPIAGGVNQKAMTADWPGNIIACVDNGQSIMVVYSPSPYISWYDITGNHGVANGINSVEVL